MKSDEPLKVSTECQHYRESRTGIDKVWTSSLSPESLVIVTTL